jgi:hypothetical protein
VVLESTSGVLSGHKNVLGYYSWGSADWAIGHRFGSLRARRVAGGVSLMDGCTFTNPGRWTIGKWTTARPFRGSLQCWAAT